MAAPSHIGLTKVGELQFDLSPARSPGKLTAAWLDGGLKGGMVIVSPYLWHSEGVTHRNLELLQAAGDLVVGHGGPWLMGGDFNMTPEELTSDEAARAWLDKIGGRIVAPKSPTCRSPDGGRVIDFFIIDRRIAHAVADVFVAVDFASSPHSAVVVRLQRSATSVLMRMLRRPPRFPALRPIGCAREPAPPDTVMVAALSRIGQGQYGHSPIDEPAAAELGRVSAGFEHLVSLAERELCGICDKFGADGAPDCKYIGRGRELAMVWRHPTPPTAREDGRADLATQALLWLSIRLSELRALMRREQCSSSGGRPLGPLGLQHWRAIAGCLQAPGRNLVALFHCEAGALWKHRVPMLALALPGVVLNLDTMWAWASEARAAARTRARAAAVGAQRSWRAFVDDQLRRGAGALHRFTRRPPLVACASVIHEGSRTTAPQHLVEADCAAWRKIWLKFEGVAQAPWRGAQLPEGERLPEITGDCIA